MVPTEEGAPCAVYARAQFSRFRTVHASDRLSRGALAYTARLDEHGASLEAGTVVRARQFATNRAGLGAVHQTDQLIMLDDTPPAHAQLRLCTAGGRYAHDARSGRRVYFQSSAESVRICWGSPGFADGESGVWKIEWQVTRRAGPCYSELCYSDLTQGTRELSPAQVHPHLSFSQRHLIHLIPPCEPPRAPPIGSVP